MSKPTNLLVIVIPALIAVYISLRILPTHAEGRCQSIQHYFGFPPTKSPSFIFVFSWEGV